MPKSSSLQRTRHDYARIRTDLIRIVGIKNFSEDFTEIPSAHLETYADISRNRIAMKNRKFVVRPRNLREVFEVIKIARRSRRPIIPIGGSTAFYVTGGPVPTTKNSIVIDLRSLNRIIGLDQASGTVTVQAGVTLKRLKEYLARVDLWYSHYPESLESATIGGAISMNGIGPFATKYGRAGEQFVRLKVVLANGKICEVGNKTNFDNSIMLRKLFSGSEGALGVIVEATLKVYRIPATRKKSLYGFANVEDACLAVKKICEAGLSPDVIMMPSKERIYNEAMLSITNPDLKMLNGREYFLFVVYAGDESVVKFSIDKTDLIIRKVGGSTIADERVAESYWKNLTETGAVVTPQMAQKYKHLKYNSFRPGIPIGSLPGLVQKVKKAFPKRPNLIYAGVTSYIFLPEMDALAIFGALLDEEDQRAVAEYNEYLGRVTRLSKELDGSLAATGGLGTMFHKFANLEIGGSKELVLIVKNGLDPNSRMNPGKMV